MCVSVSECVGQGVCSSGTRRFPLPFFSSTIQAGRRWPPALNSRLHRTGNQIINNNNNIFSAAFHPLWNISPQKIRCLSIVAPVGWLNYNSLLHSCPCLYITCCHVDWHDLDSLRWYSLWLWWKKQKEIQRCNVLAAGQPVTHRLDIMVIICFSTPWFNAEV